MADTGYKLPTVSVNSYWTNHANARLRDGNYANTKDNFDYQSYGNFDFNVPAGAVIDGIEIRIKGHAADSDSSGLSVYFYNGTTFKDGFGTQSFNTGADQIKTYGGPTDTWGETWEPDDFSNANFVFEVYQGTAGKSINVDYIEVSVYYTESGGGEEPVNALSFGANF